MGVWDVTAPADSDFISLGDDQIRADKSAIQEALQGQTTEGLEAIFPGSAPTTAPVFRYRGLKDTTVNRPAAGQYGLFFDTTRQALQRDNGVSWDDIAGGVGIVSGVKMLFYQASAPTGWTAVAANDRFLRVVTAGGTGGTTGGSGTTPSGGLTLAHSHTINSHTHDLSNHTHSTPSHQHLIEYTLASHDTPTGADGIVSGDTDGAKMQVVNDTAAGNSNQRILTNRTENSGSGTSGTPSNNTSGAATPGTDTQLGNPGFQYADVIIATKD